MISATVMVIQEEKWVRELIHTFLKEKGYKVIEVNEGSEVIELLKIREPDLILLDAEMPGINSLEVCVKIRSRSRLPILFISYRKELSFKIQSLDAGGDDFITKPFDFNELEARIRAVLRRTGWTQETVDLTVLRYGDLHIHADARQVYIGGNPIHLNHKEFQLLLLLAQQPNRVWTAEQLYNQIWGYYSAGELQTVKVHISNLRRKVEKDPANPIYIRTIRGFGYKFAHNTN